MNRAFFALQSQIMRLQDVIDGLAGADDPKAVAAAAKLKDVVDQLLVFADELFPSHNAEDSIHG